MTDDEEYSPPNSSIDGYSRDIGVGTFSPNDEDRENNSLDGTPPPASNNNFTENADKLPSDFKIMEVQKLNDQQKRHCIVLRSRRTITP